MNLKRLHELMAEGKTEIWISATDTDELVQELVKHGLSPDYDFSKGIIIYGVNVHVFQIALNPSGKNREPEDGNVVFGDYAELERRMMESMLKSTSESMMSYIDDFSEKMLKYVEDRAKAEPRTEPCTESHIRDFDEAIKKMMIEKMSVNERFMFTYGCAHKQENDKEEEDKKE